MDLDGTRHSSTDNNWRVRLPNKLPRGFSLWEFSQQDIAAALTAIEVDLMIAVPIEELTNCAWNCKESEQLAPSFLALRAWGEQVRLWVQRRLSFTAVLLAHLLLFAVIFYALLRDSNCLMNIDWYRDH